MYGSRFIDAHAGLQVRHAVDAGRERSGQAQGLMSAVKRAAHGAIDQHMDAVGGAATIKARFDSAVDTINAKVFTRGNTHFDAIGAEGGGLFAGELRKILGETLEEKHPTTHGLEYFPVDSSLPLGIRSFAVRRFYEAGEARVHRAGDSDIPRVSMAQVEREFQIRHYITSYVWDVFEEMSANAANFAMVQNYTRIARDTLERFANEMIWYGDPKYQILGILNYPWLDKEIADQDFYGTPADSRTVLTALNSWANRQHHVSKGVMGPTEVVTSDRIADWIGQTMMGTTTEHRDRTIGEVWKATGRIKGDIKRAWEMENLLGDGIDGILFYRPDPMGIVNVMPGGGVQSLPLYQTDIERRQILYMSHGGVLMREVGNNLLVFVNATA